MLRNSLKDKLILFAFLLFSFPLFAQKDSLSVCGLAIGSKFQGGIVFYIDNTGCHGLVCAPTDQSTGEQWNREDYVETNATNSEIGSGAINTKLIVASGTKGVSAATLCDDLIIENYSDWYLPSIDEVYLMYKNLYLNQLGDLKWGYYWSSTEFSDFIAWYVCFYDGVKDNSDKSNLLFVRAVRSF